MDNCRDELDEMFDAGHLTKRSLDDLRVRKQDLDQSVQAYYALHKEAIENPDRAPMLQRLQLVSLPTLMREQSQYYLTLGYALASKMIQTVGDAHPGMTPENLIGDFFQPPRGETQDAPDDQDSEGQSREE